MHHACPAHIWQVQVAKHIRSSWPSTLAESQYSMHATLPWQEGLISPLPRGAGRYLEDGNSTSSCVGCIMYRETLDITIGDAWDFK